MGYELIRLVYEHEIIVNPFPSPDGVRIDSRT